MNKRKTMKLALTLLAGLSAMPAAYAGTVVQDVLDCMHANLPPAVRVQSIELDTTDRGGATRVLKGRLYVMREQGQIRANLKIDAPESYAGASYLVRQASDYLHDGMYVYLPSVRRVKRITGTFADGALLGTDFSYNDFRQLFGLFDRAGLQMEDDTKVEDRPVHVMSLTPSAKSMTPYNKVRAWIDSQTCVPLKFEMYKNNAVQKRLTVPGADLLLDGHYWTAGEVRMDNLTSGTSSVLKVARLQSVPKLPAHVFDPALFYESK